MTAIPVAAATISRDEFGLGIWTIPEQPGTGPLEGTTVEGLTIFAGRNGWFTIRHESDGSHEKYRRRYLLEELALYGVTVDDARRVGLVR